MTRRTFVASTVALTLAPLAWPFDTDAQDREWVAALERAQRERPKTIGGSARIAPESEPGDPLVVHGRALGENDTPVAGAVVFAYHTDRHGLYDVPGAPPHRWRLKGWAKTDADGAFEFRTIRPGAYPQANVPQHLHLTIFLPDGRRYWAEELQFEDDPKLPAHQRAAAVRVRREGHVQHVDFTFRLRASHRF
jgi:protocatechuate 3,4-dioxygenase beta subunit